MAVTIGTDTYRKGHVVKHEYEPGLAYCVDNVTALEAGAKTYVVGTVLGKITASGKFKICEATAVDGSQNAAAVVVEDKAVAATTDTPVLALVRGPAIVAKQNLTLGSTIDTDGEKTAVYDSLKALGILVSDVI